MLTVIFVIRHGNSWNYRRSEASKPFKCRNLKSISVPRASRAGQPTNKFSLSGSVWGQDIFRRGPNPEQLSPYIRGGVSVVGNKKSSCSAVTFTPCILCR